MSVPAATAGVRSRPPVGAVLARPHAVLAASVAVALACELASQLTESAAPMLLAAAVAFGAFAAVWQAQDRLRLLPLLGLTLAFHLAWIALHLGLGVTSFDSEELYRGWGNELLAGEYPEAQYPPAAVLLFALAAWLGGGATRTSHAFLMVPFQLLAVTAVWALRTRTTPWLAALVALWPMNAFFWEFRFDLVPTALLALGLLLAFRERWTLAGLVLGLGAAVKWTPGIAFALLAIWLVASARLRRLAGFTIAFAGVFVLTHLPFLLWSPEEATYTYRYFGGQGVTGESIWYLLLAPLGLATVDMRQFWLPADVPGWVDPAVTVVQAVALLALAVVAARVRADLRAAIAVAAMGPVLFLLLNRIFSPQYLVLMLAAWAIAGALVLTSRRQQLLLGMAAMGATTANAFVYPYTLYQLNIWQIASAALFAGALAATVFLIVRASGLAPPDRGGTRLLACGQGRVAADGSSRERRVCK